MSEEIKFITIDKEMANGMRNTTKTPLTDDEIEYVKSQIKRIKADESVFIFNDDEHIESSTCYNFLDDLIYITRNVFPDEKYFSTHPRDIMSVACVLAHEYYGHRPYRDEYLDDYNKGDNYHSIPVWEDECRASINASKLCPNLTQGERKDLIMDSVYRAKESGQVIQMDDYMKEVVYGFNNGEKNITPTITPIIYVSEASIEREEDFRSCRGDLSEVPSTSRGDYHR